MGEVERAQALLQAAGVSGVKVQEQAEMVTMSRAEADALRAGAAPGATAETPGQAYERERSAQQAQPVGPTADDLRKMTAAEIAKLPQADVDAALAEPGRS